MDGFYEFIRSLWVLWLMILFLGIVVWVVWPSHKKRLEKHGEIPFKDDEDLKPRVGEEDDTPGGDGKGERN